MTPRKILVANRGEIALRIIRACKELGIRSVAVYSEADRWAHYVSQADEAYPIGPAPSQESYLRMDTLIEVARRCGAEALHPGYGFLAERAELAEACRKAGITFIGPRPSSLRRIGNKLSARRLAERNAIPVVPGLSVPVDEAMVRSFAKRVGYPVLLKAAGGGGGKGMRVLRHEREIGRALREASGEAGAAFGDATLFVEKYLEKPRHIEIQILADDRGHVLHLGERECSIQRRHQKLVEESPAVVVDEPLRARMGEAAKTLAQAAGYTNAGTCEFLLDGDGRFYFLEVNARLQVEHPVTEMVTGIDLVHQQIRIASGEELSLRQEDILPRGHAIECRICAEDPFSDFAPSTGEIAGLRFPAGPFVRVDSDLSPRSVVSVYYDSLIAKVIVWAEDRPRAIQRMKHALREFKIVGVATTIPFHLRLLDLPAFKRGKLHTRFLEHHFKSKERVVKHQREAALLAAALEFQRCEQRIPRHPSARPLSPWKVLYRGERK